MPSKETLELIGKAVAVAAFLFTAFSYANNLRLTQKTARYEEARELIGLYRTDGVRDAEQELFARSLYYRDDGLDPNDPGDYPDRILKEIATETLFGTTGAMDNKLPGLLSKLLDIADFYAEVSFCLAQKICDPVIAEQYFCPRAISFEKANRRLIAYYSDYSNSEDWSDGFLSLASRCQD